MIFLRNTQDFRFCYFFYRTLDLFLFHFYIACLHILLSFKLDQVPTAHGNSTHLNSLIHHTAENSLLFSEKVNNNNLRNTNRHTLRTFDTFIVAQVHFRHMVALLKRSILIASKDFIFALKWLIYIRCRKVLSF